MEKSVNDLKTPEHERSRMFIAIIIFIIIRFICYLGLLITTIVLSMNDETGILSLVLKKVADFRANLLTIHQTIPVNGVASLTLSVEILQDTLDPSKMIEEIEALHGVRYLKILSSDATL